MICRLELYSNCLLIKFKGKPIILVGSPSNFLGELTELSIEPLILVGEPLILVGSPIN